MAGEAVARDSGQVKRRKGGPRPNSGRPKGIPATRTLEERAAHAKNIARWARKTWRAIPDSERPDPPSKDNLIAARAWLDDRRSLLIDKAILSGDLKTAAIAIEDAYNRIEGRPKYQHELGGEGGGPVDLRVRIVETVAEDASGD
jgi:hypothetical protein